MTTKRQSQKPVSGTNTTTRTAGRSQSALVLDDNADFRQHLGRILTDRFAQVHLAESFAEANDLLEKEKIDFAILDYMLPDGNGVELGAKTRERLDIPVVIVTGTILPPEEEDLCEEFDMPVLRKPFLVSDLLSIITGRFGPPTIFIGHGRSQEWKDLRHFLSARLK